MRFSITSSVVALLASCATLSLAATQDVYAPTVTEPSAGTLWLKGSNQTVKWDVTNHPDPSQITNREGKIFLKPAEGDILLDKPLAQGFDILEGSQDVTVPKDVDVGRYQVVLFGDSGNWGEEFLILG